MSLNTILIDGDLVLFDATFVPAIVTVRPVQIEGSGKTTIKGKNVCLQGDETKVVLANCSYFSASFPVPGIGSLKIASIAPNQSTKKSKSGNKSMLLKGSVFNARFEVQSPAQLTTPTGTLLDTTPFYMGTGKFISTNNTIKAT